MSKPYLLRDLNDFETFATWPGIAKQYGTNTPKVPHFSADSQSILASGIETGIASLLSTHHLRSTMKTLACKLASVFCNKIHRRHYASTSSRCLSPDSASPFMSQPVELIWHIMPYLPGSALRCLRQTCTSMMVCFDAPEFARFHLQSTSITGHKAFNTHIFSAVYFWLIVHHHIILSMRYLWCVEKPTSLGCLSLLDDEYRQRLLTEETKYALWCETPSCRTNTRGRWESLVKEDSERAHLKALQDALDGCWDYQEAVRVSQNSSFQNW